MDAKIEASSPPEPTPKEMSDHLFAIMRGLNAQAFRAFGNKVIKGPFEGMIIPPSTPWDDGNASTKLVGTYEHELHPALGTALARRPQVIVNVGCAEGYYAIGLARACPEARVFAMDISEESRFMCEDYAELNRVSIEVLPGAYEPDNLCGTGVKGRRLYVVDVEGSEDELIDPIRVPELVMSDMIVECHDFMKPGVAKRIRERFLTTHVIDVVLPKLPDFQQFDFLRAFPSVLSVLMVVEKRPMPCCWLACWAKYRGDENG